MKSKKDIKRDFKQRKKQAGVFQLRNTVNNKVLLGSSLNLEGLWNSNSFQLRIGSHRNKELQKDWNKYGSDKFVFEILEVVKNLNDPNIKIDDELTLIEQIWLEKIQPYGDKGYNQNNKIRKA